MLIISTLSNDIKLYIVYGRNVQRAYCAEDLSVFLDARLSLEEQLEHGLVINMTRKLRVPICIKTMYYALTNSLLEYVITV